MNPRSRNQGRGRNSGQNNFGPGGRRGGGRRQGISERKNRMMIRPSLLTLLNEAPAHGYQLLENIREFGAENVDTSVIYRNLARMEDYGWIETTMSETESKGPARKTYKITEEGQDVLRDWIVQLKKRQDEIEKLIERATNSLA